MITAIDGDMLARRWEGLNHTDAATQRMLEHLYKLRRCPEPFRPPDKMCIAFSDGSWRPGKFRDCAPKVPKARIISACNKMDVPVVSALGFESCDILASLSIGEEAILVTDDLRLCCAMSDECSMYRPTNRPGTGWELYSERDWRKQYGPRACKNWQGFLHLIGMPNHGYPRQHGPHHAARACEGTCAPWMGLAVVGGIQVPEISPTAKGYILQSDIEHIAEAIKKHEQRLYESALRQLRHEVDPSQPTDFPKGSVERQVIHTLRREKGLPIHVEGDAQPTAGAQ